MNRVPPTGRRAVIVGNGPSVDLVPPAAWGALHDRGWLLVGTNRALVFSALQGVSLDAMILRDGYRDLWLDKTVAWNYHQRFWKPFTGWKAGPANDRVSACDEFLRFEPGWQYESVRDANRERAVMRQSSVVLMAANWAWLCGVRYIAFLGVDYTGGDCAAMIPGYAVSTGWEGRYAKMVPEAVERQFSAAVSAVTAGGGSMANLSRGTHLKAVPTAELENILERRPTDHE